MTEMTEEEAVRLLVPGCIVKLEMAEGDEARVIAWMKEAFKDHVVAPHIEAGVRAAVKIMAERKTEYDGR